MLNEKPVVVSGIRATGRLHLGNYIGAMQNFSSLQDEFNCHFFVADYHTLTSLEKPQELRDNLPEIVLDYLAAGLDPDKSVIFAQSSVPQIAELALLLGMITSYAELGRCPTFKEKIRSQPDNVNLGLFSYPVLMAADILIQKAILIPVGKDQLPHIEMARVIARRFNHRYKVDLFPEPKALMTKVVKVPGIDGSGKMGKSEHNTIDLRDTTEEIRKKIGGAVTDVSRIRRTDPGHPSACNMYALHKFVTSEGESKQLRKKCVNAQIGCVECKRMLAEAIITFLAPFQARRAEIAKNPVRVKQVLYYGGKKARFTAAKTLEEVRKLMGLEKF